MAYRKRLLRAGAAGMLAAFAATIFVRDARAMDVAKKGVGDYPGIPAAVANLTPLRVGWYYDWGVAPVGVTPGIHFVPMIWSHKNVNPADLKAAVSSGSGVLLGFNEPNVHDQANMTVEQAIADWPQLEATGLRLGSPAGGTGDDMDPKGWLARFMAQAKAKKYRVDFICIHPYQSDFDPERATEKLRREIVYVHDTYHLPIWVTEFAMANWETNAAPDAKTAARFATLAAAMMDRLPYVERYAWYSLIPKQQVFSLENSDGVLNEIGLAWADAAGGVTANKKP